MIAEQLTCLLLAANLGLYTAYNKTSKKLDSEQLANVLLFRKGVDYTLVELNKILALTTISTQALAILPFPSFLGHVNHRLLFLTVILALTHVSYSVVKFYNTSNLPFPAGPLTIKEDLNSSLPKTRLSAYRRISNTCGGISNMLLISMTFGVIGFNPIRGVAMVGASVAHFYLMEIDYSKTLRVRPYGYMPFYLAGFSIAVNLLKMMF